MNLLVSCCRIGCKHDSIMAGGNTNGFAGHGTGERTDSFAFREYFLITAQRSLYQSIPDSENQGFPDQPVPTTDNGDAQFYCRIYTDSHANCL